MNLVIKAPFNSTSGYAKVLDIFTQWFPKCSIKPYYIPTIGNINSQYNPFVKPFPRYIYEASKQLIVFPMALDDKISTMLSSLSCNRPRVVYTMHETTQLLGVIVDLFNKTNGIIVPNKWNKENFIKDGVTCPIEIVPLGVNSEVFKYYPPNKEGFTFGCGNNDYRKRLPEIIKCFCKAFPPNIKDVKLKIKISKNDKTLGNYVDERIEITRDNFSLNQMVEWYKGINVFVSVSYAEGWGLMQQESMACGRPIISPYYGGITEFFDDTVGYSLDYTETLSGGPYLGTGGFWAEFNPDDLISKMRWCYNNRENVYFKGILSSKRSLKFEEKDIVPRILNFINSI